MADKGKHYAEGPADYNGKPPKHSGTPTKIYPASSKIGSTGSGGTVKGPADTAIYSKRK